MKPSLDELCNNYNLICSCQPHFIYAILGVPTLVIVLFLSCKSGYIGKTPPLWVLSLIAMNPLARDPSQTQLRLNSVFFKQGFSAILRWRLRKANGRANVSIAWARKILNAVKLKKGTSSNNHPFINYPPWVWPHICMVWGKSTM